MNPLLRPVATDFLFSGNDILSFIFFEKIIAIRGRPILKKNYICQQNHFLQVFQALIRMEAVFRSTEICFSTNSLFQLVEKDFGKFQDFVLLIRAFFCWWTLYLKLGVHQFFRFFQFETVAAVFLTSRNRFVYQLLHYGEWKQISCLVFFLFRANFALVENITRIKVKPFFKE